MAETAKSSQNEGKKEISLSHENVTKPRLDLPYRRNRQNVGYSWAGTNTVGRCAKVTRPRLDVRFTGHRPKPGKR